MKEIWKWILDKETNNELSKISTALNISVPGFRKGNVTNITRTRIINLFLEPKNIIKLNNSINIKYDEIITEEEYRLLLTGEVNEAIDFILNNIPPSLALKILISNKELERVEEIYLRLSSEGIDEINSVIAIP